MTDPLGGGASAADRARLHAVRLAVLAASDAAGLDRLTALAKRLLDVPVAQVSLAGRVQVVVSRAGDPLLPEQRVRPVSDSLCAVTAAQGAPLVLADAGADSRVAHLRTVVDGGVGAYLGVPLVSAAGHVLGALCAWDREPREWSPADVEVLTDLAGVVSEVLDAAVAGYRRRSDAARVQMALTAADIGSFDWDMTTGELTWDDRLVSVFGLSPDEAVPRFDAFVERIHPEDVERFHEAVRRAVDGEGDFAAEYRIALPDGTLREIEARGRVLPDVSGRPARLLGAAYDATELRESARVLERAVAERELALRAEAAASERLRVLADASVRLSASLEPQQVLATLADVLLPAHARFVVVALTAETAAPLLGDEADASASRLVPVLVAHVDAEARESLTALLELLPLTTEDPHGIGAVVRTGEPEWLPEIPDEVLVALAPDEDVLARLRAVDVTSALTLPLVSRGRTLGAIAVADPTGGQVDSPLLVDLVARAALALENALLYRGERRAGIVLQRSLLPQRVPQLPGIAVAVRYLPGTSGAFVGGDWYQGVHVDGRLVLAMGDVMGHGLRSAARMGQLRAIVATLALDGHGPGPLLERLSTNVDVLLDLELATLLVASYDPSTRRLVLAAAGHPPPLLAPLDAEARYVDVEPGPPLGVMPTAYAESEVDVPPGAALVLFTDGLVEQRDEGVGPGLDRLRRGADRVDLAPQQLADHLLEVTGRREGGDDDVALLVLRHLADDAQAAEQSEQPT